jgi:hypothetical protein
MHRMAGIARGAAAPIIIADFKPRAGGELGGTGEGYSRIWHLRANISITPLAAPMPPGLS